MRSLRRVALFRRFALALATAQAVAYAAAPAAEARVQRPSGPPGIERAHSSDCVPVHQPKSCLFCHIVSVRIRRAEGASPQLAAQVIRRCPIVPGTSEPGRPPARHTWSRAPPTPVV